MRENFPIIPFPISMISFHQTCSKSDSHQTLKYVTFCREHWDFLNAFNIRAVLIIVQDILKSCLALENLTSYSCRENFDCTNSNGYKQYITEKELETYESCAYM